MAYASFPDPDNIARKSTNPPPLHPHPLVCLILRGTWFDIGIEDGINEHEGPVPVMESETEASMDASTSSRWGAAGTVGEETAACRTFRASLTTVWILESSLSRSWSIRAGSAPTAEGPGVLVSWWWAGSGAAFEAFLAGRRADMVSSSGGPLGHLFAARKKPSPQADLCLVRRSARLLF